MVKGPLTQQSNYLVYQMSLLVRNLNHTEIYTNYGRKCR